MSIFVERVWVAGCSRCANESQSDEEFSGDAIVEMIRQGWTSEEGRQFCPQCSGAR